MLFGFFFLVSYFTHFCCSNPPVEVELDFSKIRGMREKSVKGREIYSFYRIPYAKPPTGSLRFKDPEPVEPWKDTLDATKLPPLCPQLLIIYEKDKPRTFEGEEDCLFLNVFTPQLRNVDTNLPVMVFFHGGAFYAGGVNRYPPYALLDEDVVLVTVNYRIGVLGFISTEDDVIPGNFGLKDQMLALKWVQKNIRHFGGDPDRVTIFGESAGGASVHYHLLSPTSNGLFARAILQSGNAFCPWASSDKFNLRQAAEWIGSYFSCPKGGDSESLLKCLQEVPFEKIAPLYEDFIKFTFSPVVFGPRVDGTHIPAPPEELMKGGHFSKVDIMSGVNREEGAFVTLFLFQNQSLMKELERDLERLAPFSLDFFEDDEASHRSAALVFDRYLGHSAKVSHGTALAFTKMYGDRHFNICHDTFSQHFLKSYQSKEKKLFLYQFNYRGEHSFGDYLDVPVGGDWVSHVDELFYLFEGGKIFPSLVSENDRRMSEMMVKMWANFAYSGNPTPDSSLGFAWQPSTLESLPYLSIVPEPKMEVNERAEIRKFWACLPVQDSMLHPDERGVGCDREKEEL